MSYNNSAYKKQERRENIAGMLYIVGTFTLMAITFLAAFLLLLMIGG